MKAPLLKKTVCQKTVLVMAVVALSACADKPKEDTDSLKPEPVASVKQSDKLSDKLSDNASSKITAPTHLDDGAGVSNEALPVEMEMGKNLYDKQCKVCHEAGLLNAPKYGDKAAWVERLAKGKEVLYEHSAKGFNKMPPQAVDGVSDSEVYAAVDYMLDALK